MVRGDEREWIEAITKQIFPHLRTAETTKKNRVLLDIEKAEINQIKSDSGDKWLYSGVEQLLT